MGGVVKDSLSAAVKCSDERIRSIMRALKETLNESAWVYLKEWIEEAEDDRGAKTDR